MLETIKHIFDIKGVVFVVATDTEQLQHAVKAVYGEGFNARTYLSRFFNSRFSLRSPDFKDLLAVHCDKEKLSGAHFDKLGITVWPPNTDGQLTLDNISSVLSCFELQARTVIQITERVIAILNNLPKGSKIDILMLTVLLSIREKDDELYKEIMSGNFDGQEKKRETSLYDFLKEEFNFENQLIQFDFVHVNFVDTLFNIGTVVESSPANYYPEGKYIAELDNYFLEIFIIYFEVYQEDIGFFDINWDEDVAQDRVEKNMKKLSKLINEEAENNIDVSNALLEYLHCDENLQKIATNDYQDLVELASALDWIDDEE